MNNQCMDHTASRTINTSLLMLKDKGINMNLGIKHMGQQFYSVFNLYI